MIVKVFNHSGHKRLWKHIRDNPWLDIDSAIKNALNNKILSQNEHDEYIKADSISCRTGCIFAVNKCEDCPFEMKDNRRCLGGLTDAFLRAYNNFIIYYKKYNKQKDLENDPKFMKIYKRLYNRQRRLAGRILNWKIKDGIKCI